MREGYSLNPNYVHTITIYHNDSGIWKRTVYRNCFWKSETNIIQNGTDATKMSTYTVRIPLEVAGAGFLASPGDIVIHNECMDEIADKSPNTVAQVLQKHKPEAFRVKTYSDNTSHQMAKHYRLGG